MARRRSRRLKNWLIYRALTSATWAASKLSLAAARRIGRGVGRLADKVLPREVQKADASIATAFPELTPAERRELISSMFQHLGISALEIAWMQRGDRATLMENTVFEGIENLREPIERGRGVVAFTGHCGNWEWLGAAISLSGFTLNAIGREIFDPRLNEFIVRSRELYGTNLIARGSGSSAREILQVLRKQEILAALIDQSLRAENALIPFFGLPAPTPIGVAKLAIRSEAACIAVFIERRGGKHHVRCEKPVYTSRGDDPVEITARMTAAIENQIRRVPEQWVWMHERWKGRK